MRVRISVTDKTVFIRTTGREVVSFDCESPSVAIAKAKQLSGMFGLTSHRWMEGDYLHEVWEGETK